MQNKKPQQQPTIGERRSVTADSDNLINSG